MSMRPGRRVLPGRSIRFAPAGMFGRAPPRPTTETIRPSVITITGSCTTLPARTSTIRSAVTTTLSARAGAAVARAARAVAARRRSFICSPSKREENECWKGSALRRGHRWRRHEGLDAEVGVDLAGEVDDAVLHHHRDGLDRLQIAGGVARDEEEVGELAAFDRA